MLKTFSFYCCSKETQRIINFLCLIFAKRYYKNYDEKIRGNRIEVKPDELIFNREILACIDNYEDIA